MQKQLKSLNCHLCLVVLFHFLERCILFGVTGRVGEWRVYPWKNVSCCCFQITLFGESAGSVCVGFHVLSPGSNVLFKRAVMQSGAPTAHWTTVSLSEAWNRSVRPDQTYFCHVLNSLKSTDLSMLILVTFLYWFCFTSVVPLIPLIASCYRDWIRSLGLEGHC